MKSLLYVDIKRLHKWRDLLRSINFWLDGYRKNPAYRELEQKLGEPRWGSEHVRWNIGIGPTACFTRAISSITREAKIKRRGPYDHVIEVDMKRAAAGKGLSINDKLHLEVAEQLGLLDQEQEQEYSRLKKKNAELRYYSYNTTEARAPESLKKMLSRSAVLQITQKLSTKKYMLVVENLDQPIKPIEVSGMTEDLWLPPPGWAGSFWLVSTTSQDVFERSEPDYSSIAFIVGSFTGDDILMLTLYSLRQAAKYISRAVGQHEHEEYWHHVVVQCFRYATMLLIPRSSNNPPDQFGAPDDIINSDNLIYHWASQGILKQSIPDTAKGYPNKYNGDNDDIYQVGNVILEAFQEYSLLQLPSSPAKQADEATKTAAHFFAYHNLIAERLTSDEIFEDNHQTNLLARTHWISHVDGQGWCLSREWLRGQGSSGPTALVIMHCSQQSKLFMKLEANHFFAKLSCLRVLDLSYAPIKSLPPSIWYLQELQYLSLRGCYNLTSPLCFPNNQTTINLLFFDLSYSNINMFHSDFFYSMPNLQALALVMCSNLEELPPSFAVLSSLRSFTFIGASQFHMKQLSLHGCRMLDYVDIKEVGALEELDLSATAIKELPDSIPNLPQLRRLLLMGVPSLRRFPWHKLRRLPDVFCLDQCSHRTINYSAHPQGAQVCISDSRLFYSFKDSTRDLVRAGELLNTFYVQITSCKATTRKMHDEEDMVTTNVLEVAPPAYDDINRRYLTDGVFMVPMDDVPPFRETERHVEISSSDRYPEGLSYLLQVTKSISMSDDTQVSCVSHLGEYSFDELEECMLRRCHRMVQVFSYDGDVLSVQNAYVSHLKSLTHFYRQPHGNFKALKHLILQYCPRLEGIVPRKCELPRLETLDILFCYNLKAIFYDNGPQSSSAGYELPCLRRIHLQELPLLEHIHIDNLMLTVPAWEKLHVRGCWSLRRLPRFSQRPGKAVEVSGERAWWDKLRWDGSHSHRGSYQPMLPPAFASHRDRVIIESYLR